jgi:membrane protease YdiL (CAAX protease family)
VGPGTVAQLSSPAAGLGWTQIFGFLLPAAAFAAASNLVPARALLLDRPAPRGTPALGFMVGAVGFVVAGALMALVAAALPRSWVKLFDLAPMFLQGAPGERLALALVAAVVAPFCEEAAFRGHLLTVLRARLRPGAAIVASALFFAALHLDPVRFLAVFCLGVVFGWLSWRAGSLWPAVAAHAANNAVATLLVVASRGELAAAADEPRPLASLAALVAGAAVLAPLLGIYRRLTPEPPPLEAALVPADPTDLDPRLRLRRIPRWLSVTAAIGVVFLVALTALARLYLRR